MKNSFHNQYFRIAVTAWSVIVLSICFFFALFKMNTLLAVFKQISLILQPFTIGFAVAYLLLPVFNGLVARFQPLFGRLCADPQKARRRNCLLCSLISVSLFILLVTALLTMVMPQLAESILGLSEKMPDYLAQTEAWLSDLLSTIRIVKGRLNPAIRLEGLLLTMYDGRTNLSMQVAEEVKRHFPGQVFATVIPRNVRLSEAPSHGKPVNAYDGSSRGSVAYKRLTEEFLKQNPLERKE